MTQAEHYEQFLALHQQPEAFVMPNVWDGLSALIVKEAGFPALATSSAALAATLGRREDATPLPDRNTWRTRRC